MARACLTHGTHGAPLPAGDRRSACRRLGYLHRPPATMGTYASKARSRRTYVRTAPWPCVLDLTRMHTMVDGGGDSICLRLQPCDSLQLPIHLSSTHCRPDRLICVAPNLSTQYISMPIIWPWQKLPIFFASPIFVDLLIYWFGKLTPSIIQQTL